MFMSARCGPYLTFSGKRQVLQKKWPFVALFVPWQFAQRVRVLFCFFRGTRDVGRLSLFLKSHPRVRHIDDAPGQSFEL